MKVFGKSGGNSESRDEFDPVFEKLDKIYKSQGGWKDWITWERIHVKRRGK